MCFQMRQDIVPPHHKIFTLAGRHAWDAQQCCLKLHFMPGTRRPCNCTHLSLRHSFCPGGCIRGALLGQGHDAHVRAQSLPFSMCCHWSAADSPWQGAQGRCRPAQQGEHPLIGHLLGSCTQNGEQVCIPCNYCNCTDFDCMSMLRGSPVISADALYGFKTVHRDL